MKYDIENTRYYKYAEGVLDGTIVAGEYIKLAAQRFFDYLDRDDIFFDKKKVDRCFRFISELKHYTGAHAGKPFILEPWQQFATAQIVGLYYKGTGLRVINNFYCEVSRKSGKSSWIAALGLYFMIADGEHNAEVDICANSKKQAKILFDMCKIMSQQFDRKGKYLRPYRDIIKFDKTFSHLKCLAADDNKLDGYNAYVAIVDEFHAAPNTKVLDVLKSSQAMRDNPLTVIITTAGFNMNGPCYQMRKTGIEVLKGNLQDEHSLYLIYSLDPEDDWHDRKNWLKCSPNLGITVKEDFIRSQMIQAENDPTLLNGFLTKNMNMWVSSAKTTWIAKDVIRKCMSPVSYDFFRGREVIIGVDLAAVSDFTCVSYMTVDEDEHKVYFKNEYYCPYDTVVKNPQYIDWVRDGYMIATPGNVCDYDYITNHILDLQESIREVDGGDVLYLFFDNWNSSQWQIQMGENGFDDRMFPFSQSLGSYNRPTREMERLVLSGRICFDENPITVFCFDNVVLKIDSVNGNCKPIKANKNAKEKIDGVIASLTALGGYLDADHYKSDIFFV